MDPDHHEEGHVVGHLRRRQQLGAIGALSNLGSL
jgi:hypothetical protein